MQKMKFTPTRAQINALNSFAQAHGRSWKAKLRDRWTTGNWRGVVDSAYLQQVRNDLGFPFLKKFNASTS